MNSERINKVEALVHEACKKESNKFGYGIWTHHIVSVVKYSKILAELLGADEEIVELSALLHDYASIQSIDFYKDHHIHGTTEAGKILEQLGYDSNKIEQVKHCIFSHRASVVTDRLSNEAKCVASADAMAHIKQVPSLLYFSYVGKGMSIDEGATYVREKIERSWNKLIPQAKQIIEKEYRQSISLLTID